MLMRTELRYVCAVCVIALFTALGLIVFPYVTIADVTMLYLVAIAIAALFGRGPSLVASSVAVLALDFCFIPPRFTLSVEHPSHIFTFAVMFAAGLVITTLRQFAVRAHTEELRSSLLSSVSHDLRTPLAVITGAATTLRDDADRLTPEAKAELLSSIVDDAQRLERVLGNLLQLTRVEAGLVPNREMIPVEELVGAALTRLEDAIGSDCIELDVQPDLVVPVDAVLFEQVLINLIDNAVKHGAPPIEIRALRAGSGIAIEVRDRGPGVPERVASRLFEKFVRASTAPGAGLGLAVTRAIVTAHGGTIRFDHPVDGGARFRLEVPS